jgi:hypothetical protein
MNSQYILIVEQRVEKNRSVARQGASKKVPTIDSCHVFRNRKFLLSVVNTMTDCLLVKFNLDPRGGRKFSLLIANVYSHKVIVTGLEEGSLTAHYLKVYDHLIGQRPADQAVAQ